MDYQIVVQEEEPRKGPWLEVEDKRLISAVSLLGERRWDSLAKASGLRRNGKSCRLRWMNYLRPNLKHGGITAEEEQIIMQLHKQWGNKWSRIARRLQGRTDNEIKNYWRSLLRKKAETTKQVSFEKQDLVAPKWDYYVCDKDDISGTSADSSNNAFELSNLAISSSSYETHLSDWVSCLSSEQTETRHQGEFCSLGSCFCYLSWTSSEVGDTRSMWNSSGLL